MSSVMKGDSPIAPITIDKATPDEVDAFLSGIRERRLRSYAVYEQAEHERKETRNEKLRTMLERHIEMFKKECKQLDAKIEKVEARVLKIRSLKMELED